MLWTTCLLMKVLFASITTHVPTLLHLSRSMLFPLQKRFCYHSPSASHSVNKLSYSMHREGVSMATGKGHLQEVLCERVQNTIWIIWLPVMTDSIPQLIREKDCDEVGRLERILVTVQGNNKTCDNSIPCLFTLCIFLCSKSDWLKQRY